MSSACLRLMLVVRGLVWAGVLASLGCVQPLDAQALSSPVVQVTVEHLTPDERDIVFAYFEDLPWPCERLPAAENESFSVREGPYTWQVHLDHWSDHAQLHDELSTLRAPVDGRRILHNFESVALLRYTSSSATSEAAAQIVIQVAPPGAELFLDTSIPGVEGDGPQDTEYGEWRVRLPLSFIRRTDALYFHTVFNGQARYYRYRLDDEVQEILADVTDEASFDAFLARQ